MSTRNARPFSKREKRVFTTVFVIGAVIIFAPLWWRNRNVIPDIQVPEPQMPTPNAFLYFVNAGARLKNSKNTGEIWNAVLEREPNKKSQSPSVGSPPFGLRQEKFYSLREKEQILKRNTAALQLARQGLKLEYLHAPVRTFNHSYSYWHQWRDIGRLFLLEQQVHIAHQDFHRAFESCVDGIAFGSTVPRGGTLYVSLMGLSIQAASRRNAWTMISKLDEKRSLEFAQQLEGLYAKRVRFSQVLEEEKYSVQSSFLETFKRADWRKEFEPRFCGLQGGKTSDVDLWPYRVYLSAITPNQVLSTYTSVIDADITAAKLPYYLAQLKLNRESVMILLSPLSDFSSNYFHFVRYDTYNTLLYTQLALNAYKLERGAYPNSLKQLTPRYLKNVPLDPFADNKPLQYKRMGSEYSLYSIGPDCVDNRGKSVDQGIRRSVRGKLLGDEKLEQRRRYRIEQDSNGDIVAGINVG